MPGHPGFQGITGGRIHLDVGYGLESRPDKPLGQAAPARKKIQKTQVARSGIYPSCHFSKYSSVSFSVHEKKNAISGN
jgi:hypothetical protein